MQRSPSIRAAWARWRTRNCKRAYDLACASIASQRVDLRACRCDLPNAEIYVLDAGHFALDEKAGQCAELIDRFVQKVTADRRS
ncbi:hypothetical protein BTO02_11615 [Paraburkholderia sp. SOS3]|nr:hypothetical protein BTO02_11615 [Paraburkholderia sp. SOS3]